MRVITPAEIADALTYPALVERLGRAFRSDIVTPVRHHHPVARAGEPDAMLLLMPAWTAFGSTAAQSAGHIGVKIVTVMPGNAARDAATVVGVYLLLSGETGEPLAILDGPTLTNWRTAAASALASSYLSRPDARRLLMVGAGSLAGYLAEAHASVRPIEEILVWNRNANGAEVLAEKLRAAGRNARAVSDLEAAAGHADIISAATLSADPLVRGAWLRPGTHVDLVGGFTPAMREADDEAIRRSRVFVDTRAGAGKEAGDIVQPIASGALTAENIAGDLFELCRGEREGRRTADEITLFKSVGTAIEDLAAAELVFERLAAG
jgi:ornithine cyclodeaminase